MKQVRYVIYWTRMDGHVCVYNAPIYDDEIVLWMPGEGVGLIYIKRGDVVVNSSTRYLT